MNNIRPEYILFFLLFTCCSCVEKTNKNKPRAKCDNYTFDNLEEAVKQPICVKVLYLRNQGYKRIPNEIFKFQNLVELDLGSNLITSVDADIASLSKLEELRISHNLIDSVSSSVSELSNLKRLSFYSNKLKNIPKPICSLSKLEVLQVGWNSIQDIPDCVSSLKNLKELRIESEIDSLSIELSKIEHFHKLNPNCKVFH